MSDNQKYIFCSSNYRESIITFENMSCRWTEVVGVRYYSFVARYIVELSKNYASATAQYIRFTDEKKKQSIEHLAKRYIRYIRS